MSRVSRKQIERLGYKIPRNCSSGIELRRSEQKQNKKASLGGQQKAKAGGHEGNSGCKSFYDVWFHHIRPRLLDIDNYDTKDLLDCLVQSGYLPDDNPGVVRSVFHTHTKGEESKTFVRITREETK